MHLFDFTHHALRPPFHSRGHAGARPSPEVDANERTPVRGHVTTVVMAVVPGRGLRRQSGLPPRQRLDESRRPRSGSGVLQNSRRRRPGQPQLQDCARSGRMLAASRAHFDKARPFEEQGHLEAARGEYQLALRIRLSNRQAAAKVTRSPADPGAIEAATPRPAIEHLRERARAATAEPLLNPTSRDPLKMSFRTSTFATSWTRSAAPPASTSSTTRPCRRPPTGANSTASRFEQAMQQIMSVNSARLQGAERAIDPGVPR